VLKAGGHTATFLRYGATLQSFLAPDRVGFPRDIVLGFDNGSQYCAFPQHPYFGATIGR
jgi:aldose 1-epimerase